MVHTTDILKSGLRPKRFTGSTHLDLVQYVRDKIMPYARSHGLASVLAAGYDVGPAPQIPVVLAAIANPGPLPVGANAGARAQWDSAWKTYQDQQSTNHDAQKLYFDERKCHEDRFEKNDKANAILHECFSTYDMSRVAMHDNASQKLVTLLSLYNAGGLTGSSGTQWQTQWINTTCHSDASNQDTLVFVERISNLVTSHQSIYPEEVHHCTLLDHCVSKLTISPPPQKEFAGLAQNIASSNTQSFEPLLSSWS
ncbi:hypothetical protein HDU99_002477 [Rhizoclosmatium hyalinum]|nr:hypothetical protein HDU99_002477 [Rhizoclosmatium hyalinum]